MLKFVSYTGWKSFSNARLDLDPLTILIGANASGKSNALDGLEFLRRTALGVDIQLALIGDQSLLPLRGGVEWAASKFQKSFMLSALVQGEDEFTEYAYNLAVRTSPHVQVVNEFLLRYKNGHEVVLFDSISHIDQASITVRLYNGKGGTKREFRHSTSVLSQLAGLPVRKEIADGVEIVSNTLQNIFILEPIPSDMRAYSTLSDTLQSSAANIAGVLAALPKERKHEIEAILSSYARHLPEQDIHRVWAEPVGRFQTDAMLYCEEQWTPGGEPMVLDARGMSDGTLRFLAILTALLTRPEGSLLVIEEVDNGLHPSRAGLLVKMLREIGAERKIDVLVTTHNPALLDALGPEMIPFVVVAHRDPETGESRLTLLEDLQNLPKLMAAGPLGEVVTEGLLEKSLSGIR
jgi:predicted ATPase